SEHAYIMPTVDEGEISALRYWHSQNLKPQVAFRTSSMESLRGLVADGFGATILSDMLYRAWSLEGKKIEIRPLTDAVPPMELGLLWREGASLNEAASAFQQFLLHACGSCEGSVPPATPYSIKCSLRSREVFPSLPNGFGEIAL